MPLSSLLAGRRMGSFREKCTKASRNRQGFVGRNLYRARKIKPCQWLEGEEGEDGGLDGMTGCGLGFWGRLGADSLIARPVKGVSRLADRTRRDVLQADARRAPRGCRLWRTTPAGPKLDLSDRFRPEVDLQDRLVNDRTAKKAAVPQTARRIG